MYDLGRPVDYGTFVVRIAGFDPFEQFRPRDVEGMYVEFVALYEGPDDNHNTSGSQINVLYAPCFDCPDPWSRYRVKPTTGLVSDGACDEIDWFDGAYTRSAYEPWSAIAEYAFEVRWSPEGMTLSVNGVEEVAHAYPTYPQPCHPESKTPDLRYLFLGRPRIHSGGWLEAPIFTYVEVIDHECRP